MAEDGGEVKAGPAAPTAAGPPLVVDLDGTLTRADTLHESVLALFSLGGRGLGAALGAAPRGKAAVKAAIADTALPDPAALPYRESVLELVREARAEGRRVELVSAADRRVAEAVAEYLGLFDAVHGSDGETNLGGRVKAEFLVRRFGEGGFDYVGDHRRDLEVWEKARRAVLAGADAETARRAERQAREAGAPEPLRLEEDRRRIRPYLKALRPHQWLKNLLIFLPLLAGHQAGPEEWAAAVMAFVAFSLTASSVYCLNDLLDLDADRAHPRKRERPFASGAVPALHGVAMAGVLLTAGFVLGSAVSPLFFGVLTLYFGATTLYSLALKRELVIDVCLLAGLYTLRVIAGTVAADLDLSPWMLALSTFLFLALAAMKRQTELVDLARNGRTASSGRAYLASDLPVVTMMAVSAGYTAVLIMALYIYSPSVRDLYESPLILWGTPPILLYWISRMVMIAHRGEMDDDPVLFAVRDPISLLCGAGILGVGLAATFL